MAANMARTLVSQCIDALLLWTPPAGARTPVMLPESKLFAKALKRFVDKHRGRPASPSTSAEFSRLFFRLLSCQTVRFSLPKSFRFSPSLFQCLNEAKQLNDGDMRLPPVLAAASIVELDLPGFCRFDNSDLSGWLKALGPKLQALNLYGCGRLRDEGLEGLRACTNLRRLTLSQTRITDEAVQLVSKHCPLMEELAVRHCLRLTDAAAEAIGEGLHELKVLALDYGHLSDAGVQAIARGCRKLKSLTIFAAIWGGQGPTITDISLVAISEGCPDLEEISLARCEQITLDGLAKFCTSAKKMRRILIPSSFGESEWRDVANVLIHHLDRRLFDYIDWSDRFNVRELDPMIEAFPNVKVMALEDACITASFLETIAKNLRNLGRIHWTDIELQNASEHERCRQAIKDIARNNPKLKVVTIMGVSLVRNDVLRVFGECPRLKSLRLQGNSDRFGETELRFHSPSVKSLRLACSHALYKKLNLRCPNMRNVFIYAGFPEEEIVQALRNGMHKLRKFDCISNEITENLMDVFSDRRYLPRLRSIALNYAQDRELPAINAFSLKRPDIRVHSPLTRFYFGTTPLTEDMPVLPAAKRQYGKHAIEEITLQALYMSNITLSVVHMFRNLVDFYLSDAVVSQEVIDTICSNLPLLETLTMEDPIEPYASELSLRARKLESLTLGKFWELRVLFLACESLHSLEISQCPMLVGNLLPQLRVQEQSIPHLDWLKIYEQPKEQALVIRECPKPLRTMLMEHIYGLTTLQLAGDNIRLQELLLFNLTSLHTVDLDLPHLRILRLGNLTALTNLALKTPRMREIAVSLPKELSIDFSPMPQLHVLDCTLTHEDAADDQDEDRESTYRRALQMINSPVVRASLHAAQIN